MGIVLRWCGANNCWVLRTKSMSLSTIFFPGRIFGDNIFSDEGWWFLMVHGDRIGRWQQWSGRVLPLLFTPKYHYLVAERENIEEKTNEGTSRAQRRAHPQRSHYYYHPPFTVIPPRAIIIITTLISHQQVRQVRSRDLSQQRKQIRSDQSKEVQSVSTQYGGELGDGVEWSPPIICVNNTAPPGGKPIGEKQEEVFTWVEVRRAVKESRAVVSGGSGVSQVHYWPYVEGVVHMLTTVWSEDSFPNMAYIYVPSVG